MKSRFYILSVSAILASLTQMRAESPQSKVIDTISIRIDPNVVPANNPQKVLCHLPYKGTCGCTINNIVSVSPKTLTFHMKRNELGSLSLTNGTNSISCVNYPWTPITPDLRLLQDIYGKENIQKVVYSDGSIASEAELAGASESLGQKGEEKSTLNAAKYNLSNNEVRSIRAALKNSNGDIAATAKKLGISEKALTRKMAAYKIEGGGQ